MFKKRELIQFSRDRVAVALMGTFLLTAILLIVLTIFNVRMSDVQLPVRYTGYGVTNIYRDHWYALLLFGGFGLVLGAVNGYLIVKLHAIRRDLSLGLAAVSLFVGLLALLVAVAVFRLAALSV